MALDTDLDGAEKGNAASGVAWKIHNAQKTGIINMSAGEEQSHEKPG